jgi:hypothetical protein
MLQPRAPLGGANSESRMRFPQTKPPPLLGLLFVAAQELDEKGGELVDRAPVAFAWEEGPQNWVRADARVECLRQTLAARFATQRVKH